MMLLSLLEVGYVVCEQGENSFRVMRMREGKLIQKTSYVIGLNVI